MGFQFQAIDYDFTTALDPVPRENEVRQHSIQSKHAAYKSKRSENRVIAQRAELYKCLLKFLKTEPVDQLNLIHVGEEFQELVSGIDLAGLKANARQRKIAQCLTKQIMRKARVTEEDLLSLIINRAHFHFAVQNPSKLKWSAFRMLEPNADTDPSNLKATFRRARRSVKDSLQDMQEEGNVFTFDNAKNGDFAYLGITRLETITTRASSKIERKFIICCIQENSDKLYVHVNVKRAFNQTLLDIVCRGVGYAKCISTNYASLNLHKVIAASNRKFESIDLSKLRKKFAEEEEKMNEEGMFYFDRNYDIMTKLHCALLHNEGDEPGEYRRLQINYVPPESNGNDHEATPVEVSTTIRFKKGTNPDEVLAMLYREGAITNIMPFLALKYNRANTIELR